MARLGIFSAIIIGLSLTGAAQADGSAPDTIAPRSESHSSEALKQLTYGAEALAGADLAGAIDAFQNAARLDPQSAGTAFTLASALALDGEIEAAAGHLKRAINLDSHYIQRALEAPEFAGIQIRTAAPRADRVSPEQAGKHPVP